MAHVSVFLALLVLFHDKFIFQSKACDSCHMTQKSVNFNDFAVVTVREMIIKLKRKKKKLKSIIKITEKRLSKINRDQHRELSSEDEKIERKRAKKIDSKKDKQKIKKYTK